MRRLFNQLKTFGFKELYRRRKKRIINSITKRLGDHLLKFYPKLPQNYEFVVLNYSVSGHFAFSSFLELCGLKHINLSQDNYMYYGEARKMLKNSKDKNFLSISLYRNFKKRLKFTKILSCNFPLVILLRDPPFQGLKLPLITVILTLRLASFNLALKMILINPYLRLYIAVL
ncbi:hypothetical protein VW212_000279 [Campylobacter upsaliensis]|nr:hypothetical protein [Campylobacter upsaliensis]